MNNKLLERAERILGKYRRWKRWKKIVSLIACIVVFCTTYALILPAITLEKDAICGKEEHAQHSESAGCYEEIKTLTCSKEETPGHEHGKSCYQTNKTLVCKLEESAPTEESEGHKHDDSCYREDTKLVCNKAEEKPHTHDSECYKTDEKLICKKEIHSHSKACYKEEATTEVVTEKTDEDTTEAIKDNGLDANGSDPKADVERKRDWTKRFRKVKLSGDWDKDLVKIARSQIGYHESRKNFTIDQDGNTLGITRYGQWYGARYGEWSGKFVSFCLRYAHISDKVMPREADPQKWINEIIKDKDLNYYTYEDDYEPKAGDLIFLNRYDTKVEGQYISDHMGIVREVTRDKDDKIKEIVVIEGNTLADKEEVPSVAEVIYKPNDGAIMGYAELPVNPKKVKKEEVTEEATEEATTEEVTEATSEEGVTEEVTTEDEKEEVTTEKATAEEVTEEATTEAVSTEEATTEEESAEEVTTEETTEEVTTEEVTEDPTTEATTEATTEEPVEETFTKNFGCGEYDIELTYTAKAEIPEEAVLVAKEYDQESETYRNRYDEAALFYGWDEHFNYTRIFRVFDISIMVDGEEIEPKDKVEVKITYKNAGEEQEETLKVTHFGEQTESLEAETDYNKAEKEQVIGFTTDSFSDYGVTLGELSASDEISFLAAYEETNPTANLIAYFKFDGNLNDSSGKGAKAAIRNSNNQASTASYGYSTIISGQSLKLEGDQFTKFLNITNSSNGSLLQGYDEISFDFWMYPTESSQRTNKSVDMWPVYAAQNTNNPSYGNEKYIAVATNTNSLSVRAEKFNGKRDGYPTASGTGNIRANRWYHVTVDFLNGQTVLKVTNQNGVTLVNSSVTNIASITSLFANGGILQIGKANWEGGQYFDGYLDEFKIYGKKTTTSGGHPQTATTKDLPVTGVGLYNVNTKDGTAAPLAGVQYTVYDSSGEEVLVKTTGDEYVLELGNFPAGTYTIKQTAVPDGYMVVPQEKTFTVTSAKDNLTQAGIFYDYVKEGGYDPEKVAQVVDYANRMFDIQLSAKSGDYDAMVEAKNFNFVVDQSNSMLFPAILSKTGASVVLHSVDSTSQSEDAGKNGERFEQALTAAGLPLNQCYYIVAYPKTKATVYAVWKGANGNWYVQDAAYYAQAQMGQKNSSNQNYIYGDTTSSAASTEATVESKFKGGPLNGIASGSGHVIGSGDLWKYLQNQDITYDTNSTTHSNITLNGNTDHSRTFDIYTGSEMNRLTYLRYAVKRMIYQLGAMDSDNEVTITTFDKNLESCMTRTVKASNPQGMIDLVNFVDGIKTDGGTSQNFGLWHVIGQSLPSGYEKSGHTKNHLKGNGKDYVVMITDGALNASGNHAVANTQEDDLLLAGERIRNYAGNPKLITIGLSVQDVTWAQSLLAESSKGGIATNGYAYLDKDADELSVQLSNALLGSLVELTPKASHANIKDYISDSFYLVDTDGSALAVGDWINLSGKKVASNASNKAGQVKKDDNGWYVEWLNQPVGTGEEGTSQTVTTYRYYPDPNNKNGDGTLLDTSKKYNLQWVSGGNHRIESTGKDILEFNGTNWQFRWANSNNTTADATSHIKTTTNTIGTDGSPTWKGKIFVKAKEDFIGGNTIDTNKGNATIDILDNNNHVKASVELETPTVNVRLLPLNEIHSEETVFLGDSVESLNDKLENLWNQVHFTKIVNNGDAVHNKSRAADTPGLENGTFTPGYAMGDATMLTEAQWTTLFEGDEITLPYTYDNDSSHGAVGYFTISLDKTIKTGENEGYDKHTSSLTGKQVEVYALKLQFTAYRITGGGNLDTREDNEHNYGNGPGTEVGGPDAGDTLEAGRGWMERSNTHIVNVVDGKVKVTKKLNADLVSADTAQDFHFKLQKKNSNGTYSDYSEDGTNPKTLTITVAANASSATGEIDGLPRGEYKLEEIIDPETDQYAMESIENVPADTNCEEEDISTTELLFHIGADPAGNDIIVHASGDGYHQNYSYISNVTLTDENVSGISHGAAIVTNKKAENEKEITVRKMWDGVPYAEYANKQVYAALTKNGQVVTDEDGFATAFVLNAGNSWKQTYKVKVMNDSEVTQYSFVELSEVTTEEKDTWAKAKVMNVSVPATGDSDEKPLEIYYKDAKYTGFVNIGDKIYTVDRQTMNRANTNMVILTNKPTYELPHTGGIGTDMFTLGGLLLIGMSLLFGFKLRRQRERRLY